MRDDLDQDEQLAQIKAFWEQYKALILATMVAAILGFGGAYLWRQAQADAAAKASSLLATAQTALERDRLEDDRAAADQLKADHDGTLQSAFAAMGVARAMVTAGDLEASLPYWTAATQADDPAVAWPARLRLAAVLLDLDRSAEGLALLEPPVPEAFTAYVADRRGDLHASLGQVTKARQSWEVARLAYIAQGGPSAPAAQLVSRKLATAALWAPATSTP